MIRPCRAASMAENRGEVRHSMGCCGVQPLLWLKAREIPVQPAQGDPGHSPPRPECFLLSDSFRISDCTSEQLSWRFSHSKKAAFLLRVSTAQGQFRFSVTLFTSLSLRMWKKPGLFKLTHWSTKTKRFM